MAHNQNASILSVLMKSSTMSDVQTLIDAMLAIQTQLSEIRDNQHVIMKTLRDNHIEQRSRLSDLKKSTQGLIKHTNTTLSEQLNELQDSVDEQNDDIEIANLDSLAGEYDLFK